MHNNLLGNSKGLSANANQNKFRHSNFKNCKTFIGVEKPFIESISNLKENDIEDIDNSNSDISLNLKNLNEKPPILEESENIPIKEGGYIVINHTNSTNNVGSYSNSFLDQRNSFLGKIRTDLSEEVDLVKGFSANNNKNFQDVRSENNILMKSTKTIAVSSRTFLSPNAGSNSMEIYSPIPDNSNKYDKYSNIFNDSTILYKEIEMNLKNSREGAYKLVISTPKLNSGNYEITSSKTDINGKYNNIYFCTMFNLL